MRSPNPPWLWMSDSARVEEGAEESIVMLLGGLDDSMEGGYENRVSGSAMLMICRPGSEAQTAGENVEVRLILVNISRLAGELGRSHFHRVLGSVSSRSRFQATSHGHVLSAIRKGGGGYRASYSSKRNGV